MYARVTFAIEFFWSKKCLKEKFENIFHILLSDSRGGKM